MVEKKEILFRVEIDEVKWFVLAPDSEKARELVIQEWRRKAEEVAEGPVASSVASLYPVLIHPALEIEPRKGAEEAVIPEGEIAKGSVICPHCYSEEGKRVVMEWRDGTREKLQDGDLFLGDLAELMSLTTRAEKVGHHWKCPVCVYEARE